MIHECMPNRILLACHVNYIVISTLERKQTSSIRVVAEGPPPDEAESGSMGPRLIVPVE